MREAAVFDVDNEPGGTTPSHILGLICRASISIGIIFFQRRISTPLTRFKAGNSMCANKVNTFSYSQR